jgi:putative ABC transport system permease protein
MKQDFPQIESVASAFVRDPVLRFGGETAIVEGAWIADPTIFETIRFPFAAGNPRSAFAEAGSVVLSESEALRLFGSSNPIGRTFTVSLVGQDVPVRVTGVLRDLPQNSHFRVPMIVRLDRSVYASQAFLFELWTSGTGVSYVRLRPGASAASINAAMPAFERRRIPPNEVGTDGPAPADTVSFSLANVRDVHLGPAQFSAQRPGNDPRRIATFSIIAVLLLAISCINFVNLTTARSTLRAREVALRKVVGARRAQLIAQFIGESILVTTVGMLLALALIELAGPLLRPWLADALRVRYFGADGLLLPAAIFTVAIGILSGAYPAFVLSRFSPIEILRANRGFIPGSGRGRLRNSARRREGRIHIKILVLIQQRIEAV